MRISVVVTTFNRPERLDVALKSIALQTGAERDVIVVNDGGVDVSDVVARWSSAIRARYVNLPANVGLARARNEGIRCARGDVLCFLDDDDVMLADHLRTGVTALRRTDADVVYTQVAVCDEFIDPGIVPTPNQVKAHYRASFGTRLLLICNFIPVNAMFIRRREHTPMAFDETLGLLEDWELWLRLHVRHNYTFSAIPLTTAVYHRVPGFGSMTSRPEAITRFHDTFRTIIGRYPSDDAFVQMGRALHERFYTDVAPVNRESAFSYEQFVERMAAMRYSL
jgi:glycosyltransferase involved in cell wall biosynthesis